MGRRAACYGCSQAVSAALCDAQPRHRYYRVGFHTLTSSTEFIPRWNQFLIFPLAALFCVCVWGWVGGMSGWEKWKVFENKCAKKCFDLIWNRCFAIIPRVLRPPGGGSNFSLGFDEPTEQPVRRNKMASSIFGTPEENPPSWAKSAGTVSIREPWSKGRTQQNHHSWFCADE